MFFPLDVDKKVNTFLKHIYENIKLNSLHSLTSFSIQRKYFPQKYIKAIGSRLLPNLENEFMTAPELLNQLICSVRNLPWQTENSEAFLRHIYIFLVSASAKKNVKATEFLGILKKYFC